jgi:trk system potassium uptake protein
MKKSKVLYVVIIGCGRLGSYLADQMSAQGHSVVVIDQDENAFSALTTDFGGFRIEGNATEFDVLKQAKLEKADIVITTTRDDNLNIMVAQIAKKLFQTPRVIARLYDQKREGIFRNMGIDVLCPTVVSGVLIMKLLNLSTTTE